MFKRNILSFIQFISTDNSNRKHQYSRLLKYRNTNKVDRIVMLWLNCDDDGAIGRYQDTSVRSR